MNSDTPQPSREEIEIRLTALLLGELPPAEAELLRWSISQDAELAKLYDRLKSTIGLVRETAASPAAAATKASAPLKMSEERRQKLLANFKTIMPKEFAPVPVKSRRKMSWLVPLAAVLMISGVLAMMLLPALSAAKRKARNVNSLSLLRSREFEVAQKLPPAPPEPGSATPQANGVQSEELRPQMVTGEIDTNAAAAAFKFSTGEDEKSPPPPPMTSPISLPSAEMSPAPASPAPVAAPGPNSLAGVDFATANTPAVGGFGGGGGFQGAAGNAGFAWKLGPSSQNTLAGNRASPTGEVYDQSLAVNDNLPRQPHIVNAQLAPGESVDSQRYYRALNASPDTVATGESKNGSFALADADKKANGIILPSNGDSEAPATPPMPADGSTFASRKDLGIATDNASAPPVESANVSGKLAYNTQKLSRNDAEVQVVDRQRQNQTGSPYDPNLETEGNAATISIGRTWQNKQSVPVTYAQSADISKSMSALQSREAQNPATGLPAAPVVAMDVPPPASMAPVQLEPVSPPSPPSLAFEPQLPRGGRWPVNAPVPNQLADEDKTAPRRPPADVAVPQPEVFTKDNVFSTFSLNVSDVSYKLAAASLENEVMPAPETIRSEEFINAFDYRDPVPPAGTPVGFAWERAGDPFAHNRDLLRFSVTTAAQGREAGRPLNLVVLLDKSGSMERADRVAIIREALKVLASQLNKHDTLSVVTFARTARLYADGVRGNQAANVFGKVSKLTPQGGTNLEEAMNLAYQTALRHYLANGVNRVVLLTDGAANLGDIDSQHLKSKVETYRKQGVALDCFGIGWEDYNDDLLEELASHADGRYGFLNHPEEAATGFAAQLAGALKVAAADVKVQVEFNPERVTAYRQIGYAKHQLTKEQFRDNTVNAAVIGAAESGNALYTVQINPQGEGPVATVRVRFHTPGKNDYQERSWMVPYTGTAVALDRASPAMRLSATAAAFAEWLQGSPYASEVTPDNLLKYLKGVPEVYGADTRPKKLEWMIRQAKSILGKG